MTVYKKKFAESKHRIYYVTTDGKFYSVTKKLGKSKRLSQYEHNGHLFININNRGYQCKNIIAQTFFKNIEKYDVVETISDDHYDLRIENLKFIPREEYIKDTIVKYQKERNRKLKECEHGR